MKYTFYVLLLSFFGTGVYNELSAQKNPGVRSESVGTSLNGSLKNGVRLPYSGSNFRYFSPLSYYILNRAYVHSGVYRSMVQSYARLDSTHKGCSFRIMECSKKKGGKLIGHRSHQAGLSVDFMTPLMDKEGKPSKAFRWTGIWHYLLQFDDKGCRKKRCIDFELMGAHLLALNDACKKNGIKIRLVVLKKELHDEFFASTNGREVKKLGIRFIVPSSDVINEEHDDHYHVEFMTD